MMKRNKKRIVAWCMAASMASNLLGTCVYAAEEPTVIFEVEAEATNETPEFTLEDGDEILNLEESTETEYSSDEEESFDLDQSISDSTLEILDVEVVENGTLLTAEDESESESETEAESESESKTEAESESESKTEAESESESETEAESESESETEEESESESETEAENKSETEIESKPESTTEITIEDETDWERKSEELTESAVAADSDTAVNAETGSEQESAMPTDIAEQPDEDSYNSYTEDELPAVLVTYELLADETETEPETVVETEAEPETVVDVVEPETEPETVIETEAEPETAIETNDDQESEIVMKTDPASKTEIVAESESEIETKVEAEVTIETNAEADSAIEIQAETDSANEPETENKSVIETEVETNSAIVIQAESDSAIESEAETDSANEPETESDSAIEIKTELKPEDALEITIEAETEKRETESEQMAETENDAAAVLEIADELPSAPDGYELFADETEENAPEAEETESELISEDATEEEMALEIELEEELLSEPLIAYSGGTASGTCGDKAKWTLRTDGVLTISGSGAMSDFSSEEQSGWYQYSDQITSIVVKSGITSIGNRAFIECDNLTSVTLPSSVSAIGDNAFAECSSLESITIPSGVKILSYGMFGNCSSLKSVTAPGIQSIEEYALSGTALTKFTVGKNVTEIEYTAFFDTPIESYAVKAGNTVFTAVDGILLSDQGKTLVFYPKEKKDTSYTIPKQVTKIGGCAFVRNPYLQSIKIGNNVTTLDESAFQECALTSVTIPDSVVEAGYFTFYGCSQLREVTFGKGLTATSYQMFENCSALTTIHFGRALKELDARTFAYCDSLVEVTLPANIKEIGNGCFAECPSLTRFTSYGLTVIPYQCFLNDSSLSEVTLNDEVNYIGPIAFWGCTSLAKITIPAAVDEVGQDAFDESTKIIFKRKGMTEYGKNAYRLLDSVSVSGERDYTSAYQVLQLVNKERAAAGVGLLVMNESLLESAMIRAAEMPVLFSHTRPDSSLSTDMNSLMYGENIAALQGTPKAVMTSWMNSEGHKENILSESYTTIGIGCFKYKGNYYWVQCFGAGEDTEDCAKPANKQVTQKVNIAPVTFSEAEELGSFVFGEPEEYTFALSLSVKKNTLYVNQSTTAECSLNNPGLASGGITLGKNNLVWSSSNPSVIKVTNGKIQALKAGTATITVTTKKGYLKAEKKITVQQSENSISAKNVTKTAKTKSQSFKLSVKQKGKGKLTYKSSSSSVKVNSKGKVTIKKNFTGKAVITIKAAAKGAYKAATKKITVTVNPAAVKFKSTTGKSGSIKLTWKKNNYATGYEIQYAANSKFSGAKKVKISKKTTTGTTIKGWKKKVCYARIRTYKTVSGKKYYSSWSKVKKITVK